MEALTKSRDFLTCISLTTLTAILALAPISSANTNAEFIKLCEQAKDYWGCFRSMTGKPSEWRSYGPLEVDWSVWRLVNGNYIAPTINSQGKSLYFAVNCVAGKINFIPANGTWNEWSLPFEGFESDLVADLCREKNQPYQITE